MNEEFRTHLQTDTVDENARLYVPLRLNYRDRKKEKKKPKNLLVKKTEEKKRENGILLQKSTVENTRQLPFCVKEDPSKTYAVRINGHS